MVSVVLPVSAERPMALSETLVVLLPVPGSLMLQAAVPTVLVVLVIVGYVTAVLDVALLS